MLIQFSARNFKSFKDPFTLDLFTNKETAVSNIIKSNFKNTYASAVFYGANGSGKSNILKAYNMMRSLVLNKDKVILFCIFIFIFYNYLLITCNFFCNKITYII